jgi:hypothetical protein
MVRKVPLDDVYLGSYLISQQIAVDQSIKCQGVIYLLMVLFVLFILYFYIFLYFFIVICIINCIFIYIVFI